MEAKIFIEVFLALLVYLGIRFVKYPKSSWKKVVSINKRT